MGNYGVALATQLDNYVCALGSSCLKTSAGFALVFKMHKDQSLC